MIQLCLLKTSALDPPRFRNLQKNYHRSMSRGLKKGLSFLLLERDSMTIFSDLTCINAEVENVADRSVSTEGRCKGLVQMGSIKYCHTVPPFL